MAEHETTADIIAAMRDEGRTGESSCLEWVGAKMRHYADRLEAAHKREAVTDSNQLREALRICMGAMCKYCVADAETRGLPTECVHGCEALLKAKAALAETEGGAQ